MSDALGTVRVVGTGLVGTSLALALRGKDVDTVLSDPSPSAVALARDLGAGRFAAPDDDVAVVVVAAPPDVVADVVAAELAAHPSAVVTDVASVKAQPLHQLTARGVDLGRYVGGHPLAGRERSGAVAARADLFVGRPWVLTPATSTQPGTLDLVRRVVELTGAVITEMPAEEHDEAVAVVSHVPQVAASLVAARLRDVPEPSVALAGQGLRDVTRIAASDPQLWTQILAGNAAAVARALHALRDDLDAVIAAVDALGAESGSHSDDQTGAAAPGARAAVARLVAAGNEGQARIPGKHGSARTAYTPVVVLVPDRPGELARLLQAVGDAGVNLEDLRLEHSEGRPMGLAEIDVLPGAAAGLAMALRAGGWTVHG